MQFKAENEKAISAISNGNFSLAESIYADLYRNTHDSAVVGKLADVTCLKVAFLNAIERFAESYRVVMDAISTLPDNILFQELLFDLLHKRQRYMSQFGSNEYKNKRGRLILGSGSGRSGSTSLTSLLQASRDLSSPMSTRRAFPGPKEVSACTFI